MTKDIIITPPTSEQQKEIDNAWKRYNEDLRKDPNATEVERNKAAQRLLDRTLGPLGKK